MHARVGHAEGPQVPDSRHPAWAPNLAAHLAGWNKIAECPRAEGCAFLPVCPQFGPPPYMTLLPNTRRPLTDCISFVVMLEHGLSEALTADHHFEQAGFKALLA